MLHILQMQLLLHLMLKLVLQQHPRWLTDRKRHLESRDGDKLIQTPTNEHESKLAKKMQWKQKFVRVGEKFQNL
jgi:hypothetical protein